MPRLYTKEAAIAAGVHVSTGKDLVDAVNELHSTVFTDSGTTLEHLLARVEALENGEAPPSLPAAPVLSYTDLLFNSVSLSWTDPDSTVNFEIWDNGSKIGNSTLTSTDLVLVPETTHELHIYAVQGAIKSVASNVISITAPAVPNVTHSVVGVTDTTIDLSFSGLISSAAINVTAGGVTTTITGSTYQITGQAAESIVNISYTQTVNGQTSSSTAFSVTMATTASSEITAVYTVSMEELDTSTATISVSADTVFDSYEYRINSGEAAPCTSPLTIPLIKDTGHAVQLRGLVDGTPANWSDSLIVIPPSIANRNVVGLFSGLGQKYLLAAQGEVVGDFFLDVYLMSTGGDTIISGFTDVDNYFRLWVNSDGYLEYVHNVAGVLTQCTASVQLVDRVAHKSYISRVGDVLTLKSAGRSETFTVPKANLPIDTLASFNNDGTYEKTLLGCILSLSLTDSTGNLLDVEPSFENGDLTVLENSGSLGNLSTVGITELNVMRMEYNVADGELQATDQTYWGEVNWDVTAASYNDVRYGVSNSVTESGTDGVFNQRVDYVISEPLTEAIRLVLGTAIRTVASGVTSGTTITDQPGNRRYYLQKTNGAAEGFIDSVTITPKLDLEDPRDTYTVIHVGDSITNYMIHQNQGTYSSIIEDAYGLKVDVVNKGIGGNTVQQMESRLPALLTEYQGVERVLVLIMAGANQDGNGFDAFETSLRNCVSLVHAAGFECGVMTKTSTVTSTAGDPDASLNTEHIYSVAQELTPNWWDATTGKPALDMWPILLGGQDQTPSLYRDNLHPSEEGEQAMVEYVAPIVAKKLKEIF